MSYFLFVICCGRNTLFQQLFHFLPTLSLVFTFLALMLLILLLNVIEFDVDVIEFDVEFVLDYVDFFLNSVDFFFDFDFLFFLPWLMTCRISFSCLFFFYSFSFQSVWNSHWSIELFQSVWNNHWSIELSLPFSSWWFFQGKIQGCLILTLDNTHGIASSSFPTSSGLF